MYWTYRTLYTPLYSTLEGCHIIVRYFYPSVNLLFRKLFLISELITFLLMIKKPPLQYWCACVCVGGGLLLHESCVAVSLSTLAYHSTVHYKFCTGCTVCSEGFLVRNSLQSPMLIGLVWGGEDCILMATFSRYNLYALHANSVHLKIWYGCTAVVWRYVGIAYKGIGIFCL